MKLLYVEEPQDPILATQFFIDEASKVEGCDYGDCMREWNRELIYLRDTLHDHEHRYQISPWVFQKLYQMQEYIQFTPNWDVESTRNRILKDSKEILDHFIMSIQAGRAA